MGPALSQFDCKGVSFSSGAFRRQVQSCFYIKRHPTPLKAHNRGLPPNSCGYAPIPLSWGNAGKHGYSYNRGCSPRKSTPFDGGSWRCCSSQQPSTIWIGFLFSVLIPVIRKDIHLTDMQYGDLTGWFTLAYTVGFLVAGSFIDRFGTRIGYATAIIWWSIAAGLHALAVSAVSLAFWRAMLGFGEAGNFPAAIKSVAEWFPKKDRAFATGLFNSGTNVASMLGPPAFVWLSYTWGWRAAFVGVASTGFLWVVLWLVFYRKPPEKMDEDDAAAVQSVTWMEALRYPQTWGFAIGKFLSDPVLVVLFVLAAAVPLRRTQVQPEGDRMGAAGGLHGGQRRQHRGRLDLGVADAARLGDRARA